MKQVARFPLTTQGGMMYRRMKREDVPDIVKAAILARLGTVQERVGGTARVSIDGELIEIPTHDWHRLVEVEAEFKEADDG